MKKSYTKPSLIKSGALTKYTAQTAPSVVPA